MKFMKEAWFLINSSSDPGQLPEHGWRKVALPLQWSLDREIFAENVSTTYLKPKIPAGSGW